MKHNLVITFDLFKGSSALRMSAVGSGQNYAAMEKAIKALGVAVKVNFSVWVVASAFDSVQARDRLAKAGDANDKIVVFDATKDELAASNLDASVFASLKQTWQGTSTVAAGAGIPLNLFATKGLIGGLR